MNKALPGVIANKVAPNPKCTGCLHYLMSQSACEIGMAPASCGGGEMPDMGYAPIRSGTRTDVVSAEEPSHAVSSRPGAEVSAANPKIAMTVSHLGDESELLALVKSLLPDLQKSCRYGCPQHQYGELKHGQHNSYTASTTCTCQPLDKSQLALDVFRQASPQLRHRVGSVAVVAKWIQANISSL